MRRARKELSAALAKGLREVGRDVAKQLRALGKGTVEDLDLDGLSVLIDPTEKQLKRVVKDTASKVLAQIGGDDVFNQVNAAAADWATARAAEMVGMKYNEDGDLVENTRAEYAIDQTTRDMLRSTISDGLEDNIGWEEIAADIEENFAFSEARAMLIARTETTNANNASSLLSATTARDELGIKLTKGWLATADACPICLENEEAGFIELDEEFPSGDDAPAAHGNCECTLIYEREEEEREEETSDDEEKMFKAEDQLRDEHGRWVGDGAHGEHSVAHGIPMSDRAHDIEQLAAFHEAGAPGTKGGSTPEIRDVSPGALRATQQTVDSRWTPEHSKTSDIPTAIVHQGEYHIVDGHHRAAEAVRTGKPLKMKVYNHNGKQTAFEAWRMKTYK